MAIFFGSAQGLSSKPDVLFNGIRNFTQAGSKLFAGDINGDSFPDLLLGNPYAEARSHDKTWVRMVDVGEVLGFISSKQIISGTILNETDAALLLTGSSVFEWFGYSVKVAQVAKKRLLIVSSPYYDNGTFSVGKLYG